MFVLILIIGIFIYFYTKGDPTSSSISSLEVMEVPGLGGSNSIGERALTLLNEVNSLKIDTSIFNSIVYQSLVDYSIEVPPQNVGRTNPFLPFPSQFRATTQTSNNR